MITPNILSVSQVNRQIKSWLESEVGEIHVEGEVSNLSKPSSGHLYFTLKDATAQLRCVYFRHRHFSGLDVLQLQNGQQVVARGQLSLYEARGDYQLLVTQLDAAGLGDLYQQFEALKAKLAALGLFDVSHKRPLPRFPQTIGIVTSPGAAALRDILTTLRRRFPYAEVILYPSDVQGKLAPAQLIQAITKANQEMRCNVLIVARGGGSIEDLWAFNDEALAYALRASQIPIVAGIGHETDFTIADFVADWRAATPTAAAEAVTPNQIELKALFHNHMNRITVAMLRYMQVRQWQLKHVQQKMASPRVLVAKYWQTIDYLEKHLLHAQQQIFATRRIRLQAVLTRLEAQHPRVLCAEARMTIAKCEARLFEAVRKEFNMAKQQFVVLMQTLHTVSPLATLDRGYALVTYAGHIVTSNTQVNAGDRIAVRLAQGSLACEVIKE